MEITQSNVLVVAAVAVLAPILADLSRRVVIPIVVAEIALGILVGPELLDLAHSDSFLEALSTFGLAFLFFLAGLEIEFDRISGPPARLGAIGWLVSMGLAVAVSLALWAVGAVDAPILVAMALTTTTLGTLMPILRDRGVLGERFGLYVIGAGTAGEFGPVIAISIVLAVEAGEPARTALLLVFAAVAVGAAMLALRAQPQRVVRLVEATMGTSGQLAIRLSLLLLVALVVVAADLGLDVILGAFAAGIIVGLVIRETHAEVFRSKLDAVGFGFLIPIFFITTGIDYDVDALLGSATALIFVPVFALLFLLARGLPALILYRRELAADERRSLAVLSAAGLPLIVAITEIGTEVGVMQTDEAVSLVGAGMLSVLIYPIIALALRRPRPRTPRLPGYGEPAPAPEDPEGPATRAEGSRP